MAYKEIDLTTLSVPRLRARRARLARQLPDVELTLRGSLQTQSRRCGKEECHCAAGELHGPYVYLAVRSGQRSRLVYIAADLAEEVKRRVEVTTSLEDVLAGISAINLELLARGELS
jgi:hypothetical protein